MPPNVKVNMISEPSDDLRGCSPSEHDLLGCNPSEHGVRHDVRHENATYDAFVEASNVKQEEAPQLLDNYDVCQDVSVKKG